MGLRNELESWIYQSFVAVEKCNKYDLFNDARCVMMCCDRYMSIWPLLLLIVYFRHHVMFLSHNHHAKTYWLMSKYILQIQQGSELNQCTLLCVNVIT